MAATREGGLKAAETNRLRDPNHYQKIGALGGKKSRGGGFALMSHEQVAELGRLGGLAGRRRSKTWPPSSPSS